MQKSLLVFFSLAACSFVGASLCMEQRGLRLKQRPEFCEIEKAQRQYRSLARVIRVAHLKETFLENDAVRLLFEDNNFVLDAAAGNLVSHGFVPLWGLANYFECPDFKKKSKKVYAILDHLTMVAELKEKPLFLLGDVLSQCTVLKLGSPDSFFHIYFIISINDILLFLFFLNEITEDELAAILAHEFGHLKGNHFICQRRLEFIENEYAADNLSVDFLHQPLVAASALAKLSTLGIVEEDTSLHPPVGERIARLKTIAKQMGK